MILRWIEYNTACERPNMLAPAFIAYNVSMTRLKLILLLMLVALSVTAFQSENGQLTITVLYTNDEHGWMEGSEDGSGAAEMVGLWQSLPGFGERTLILSGGDMWTGPDVSTWHDGESMVEVMNAMGYAAAAVGNHEFDFGPDVLAQRAQEMSFPMLAANLRDRETGNVPDFVKPYQLFDVDGIMVGVIGLSLLETPTVSHPRHVAGFEFLPYAGALRTSASELKAAGAELLFVISHVCLNTLNALLSLAEELGISMLGGGHCNELSATVRDDVALVGGGTALETFAKVDIALNPSTRQVIDVNASVRNNEGGTPDAEIAEIVGRWRALTDEALAEVIGYSERGIENRSVAMTNLVTDSWLVSFPNADAALTNFGGFRQDIPAGDITRGTILGVMPFENNLVEATLTGQELLDNIRCCDPAVAGITTIGPPRFLDGTPIDPESEYTVLVTDFMFAGGSGYSFPQDRGLDTNLNWRQPLIDLLLQWNTTPEDPLDNRLDSKPR
jgi:2',3'-cyclic-nucleotide 2'-phosphodiesterase (5'-nucleotidase family)